MPTDEYCMAKRKRSSLSSSSRSAQRPASRSCASFQRPLDCRNQAGAIVFQHVIDRTLFERIDRPLLADGPRDKNKRRVRPPLPRDCERERSVKTRQSIVGKNEIGREAVQRLLEVGCVFDAAGNHEQSRCGAFPVAEDSASSTRSSTINTLISARI